MDDETTNRRMVVNVDVGHLEWVPLTKNLQEAGMASPEATMVRDWRFQIQKAFLGKSRIKSHDADMTPYDTLFDQIEACEMSILDLEYSKIGKVMRHIAGLPDGCIPKEHLYGFRRRAMGMAERWRRVLDRAKRIRDLEEEKQEGEEEENSPSMLKVRRERVMPGSLDGVDHRGVGAGASVDHSSSNGAPTSVLDWVRSQILEVNSGGVLGVDECRDDPNPPGAHRAVYTDQIEEVTITMLQEWRDTLQRAFLPEPIASLHKEVQTLSTLFAKIEAHQHTGTLLPSHIASSGIGSVMCKIAQMRGGSTPRDIESVFRWRAWNLVGLWRGMGVDGLEEELVADGGRVPPNMGTLDSRQRGESMVVATIPDNGTTPPTVEKDAPSSSPTLLSNHTNGITLENPNLSNLTELMSSIHIDSNTELPTQSAQDQEGPLEDWKLVSPEPETPRGHEHRTLPVVKSDGSDSADDDWELVQP